MSELDLKNSKLILEGTQTEQDQWSKKIEKRIEVLKTDQDQRKRVYKIRKDFFKGNQGAYTNIVGLVEKEKKGHANAVINYAGKTATKIVYGLSNNPPKITIPALDPTSEIEQSRSQANEDFMSAVFYRNKFWKKTYKRAAANQVVVGDAAIKTYPVKKEEGWDIKIIPHEKMENLLVGWRGDDCQEFDYVVAMEQRSVQSVENEFGIKVPEQFVSLSKEESAAGTGSSWQEDDVWDERNVGLGGRAITPSGKTAVPSVLVKEYDDENVYAIKVGEELVQLIFKDGINYPKIRFWTIIPNITNPGSPWSISDIDFLIDPQIELNEGSNEERDFIRVGSNQKFVATNMSDFDPESVKPGSGQVIFINDGGTGTSKFEPLPVLVNTFPSGQFLNRMKKHLHDLGIPEVAYGSSGADSGRSKSIDYQSMVDLIVFKRDAWELALIDICEKIQILGDFYFKHDFFKNSETKKFALRPIEFDWTDILPVTAADKVVNVLNKLQMGLSYHSVLKELGYKDVEAEIVLMKQEAKDKELMTYRSKMWALAPGIAEAQAKINQGMEERPPATPSPNAGVEGPTLVPSQNEGREVSLPAAVRGGTQAFSTPGGVVAREKQNLEASGA